MKKAYYIVICLKYFVIFDLIYNIIAVYGDFRNENVKSGIISLIFCCFLCFAYLFISKIINEMKIKMELFESIAKLKRKYSNENS